MRPWSPWLCGAPQRFPIEGHRSRRRLSRCGQTPDDTGGPRSHVRCELVPMHVPKDRMEHGCTRRVVGEAERLSDPRAIIPSPCGDGALAARATQHRTTRQGTYGAERMTFATRLTK